MERALVNAIQGPFHHGVTGGVGLDECNGGPWLDDGMRQVAKAAYRRVRAATPEILMGAWTGDPWLRFPRT